MKIISDVIIQQFSSDLMVILVNIENYTYGVTIKFSLSRVILDIRCLKLPIGRIAMLVCFDMWYFENWRILKLMGADIVCCPTNWVDIPPAELRTMGNASCNGQCQL